MMNLNSSVTKPSIVKFSQPFRNGIQSYSLNRIALGFVLRGTKKIYYGDTCHQINQGDVFYLSLGNHYIEDLPCGEKPFEQIIFYYTPEQLSSILTCLNQHYLLSVKNDHECELCRETMHLGFESWPTIKNFFCLINQCLKEDFFAQDRTAEAIKMTELVYFMLTQENACVRHKILSNIDSDKEQFEQTIYNHIFTDISIDGLSRKCNKSLTSFKKEFKRYFFSPPHRWFLKQRLMHSRLLLLSTEKSVAQIGLECNFPNTSHFIKLFKKEFLMTPAIYRNSQNTKTETTLEAK